MSLLGEQISNITAESSSIHELNESSDFSNSEVNVDGDDNDNDPREDSNEAVSLLTEPKRRRLSDVASSNSSCPSASSFTSSSGFGMPILKFNQSESKAPLDTETIAREVRIVLRQKSMRQTDLAPFIGCRPGSVAGVIAKSKVPWSQLNEFNRKVYAAMAKWVEDAKNDRNTYANARPLSNANPSSPVPSVSTVTPSASISPDLLNAVVHSSSSPTLSLPPAFLSQANYSQPWATAKCTFNTGYLLFLENLYLAVPGRGTLLAGANLSLALGKRYGLVGPSECGSSTLMRFIAAKDDLNIPADLGIIACDQSNFDPDKHEIAENQRVADYVLDFDSRWHKLKSEEAVLEPLIKRGDNREAFARLRQIYEQLCFFGSGAAEGKVRQMLTGLGFSIESQDSLVKDLSARGRKVVKLAHALFSEPPLLLLDRPTNFLDVDSVIWLENYLKNWPTCLLIVTQDRLFMDAVCSTIIYVHNQQFFYYQGNYSSFKSQLAQK